MGEQPRRALEWARELRKRGKVDNPAVVGAIIDLGVCLNLLDREYLKLVKDAYQSLIAAAANAGRPMPENKPLRGSRELLLRYLDCATINLCTELRLESFTLPKTEYGVQIFHYTPEIELADPTGSLEKVEVCRLKLTRKASVVNAVKGSVDELEDEIFGYRPTGELVRQK